MLPQFTLFLKIIITCDGPRLENRLLLPYLTLDLRIPAQQVECVLDLVEGGHPGHLEKEGQRVNKLVHVDIIGSGLLDVDLRETPDLLAAGRVGLSIDLEGNENFPQILLY